MENKETYFGNTRASLAARAFDTTAFWDMEILERFRKVVQGTYIDKGGRECFIDPVVVLQMAMIESNKQNTVLYGILMCEYAASNRLEDMLARLLEDKDVSEMECPQVPILCATLSSIIKNRETKHFTKAVDILWELYEVVPNYPLEMFANLIIDILICRILMDLTSLDTVDNEHLVNDILESFRIPGDIRMSDENRKWLCKKYEAISQKLIVLIHNDGKDHLLSYLNLRNCDCFWNNIDSRVELYLDKVNEKFGRPVLEVLLRQVKQQYGKKKREAVETSKAETRSNEMQAEDVSSDCREGTSASPPDVVSTNDGETAPAVGRFDQSEIDEEHQHEIRSQANCQSKENLSNNSVKDVCLHSGSENRKNNSTSQDILSTVHGITDDKESDFPLLNEGEFKVCLKTQTDSGKEMKTSIDDETGSLCGYEKSERSLLCEDDKVCPRTQKGGGKERNNFSDDETGSQSGVEETDCSTLNEDDELSQECRPKFPIITDIPSTADHANIRSKSCDSLILFDSDNTADETVDKEELGIHSSTTNGKDYSTSLSVNNKAGGNNHGHAINQEAVKKDLNPSTEICEGLGSVKANTSNDVNGAHTKKTATKYISCVDGQPVTLFTESSGDLETSDELNEEIVKKETIGYLTGIVNESESPAFLGTTNNEMTGLITEEEAEKNMQSTGCKAKTIKNVISIDDINNNNEVEGLILKEAGGKDRMLVSDYTCESDRTDSSDNPNDTSNSLDIINNNNEMGCLISKEVRRDHGRILANDHTSECVEEVGVSRHVSKGIAQKNVTKVSDSKLNGKSQWITNKQPCRTEITQVHTANSSLSHNKDHDRSFTGKDAVNERLTTGQPDCPSTETAQNPFNITMRKTGKNSIIKDRLGGKDNSLAASETSTGIHTSPDNGKHITCKTAITDAKTQRPFPVNGVPTVSIYKKQGKAVSVGNAFQERGYRKNTRIKDTSVFRSEATIPLQNVSDFPDPDHQTSSNVLVDSDKTKQGHQNKVPSSKNIHVICIDNTQSQRVTESFPLVKISNVRSLATSNDANVCHTVKKEPITKATNTPIAREADRPSAELPSTNKKASIVIQSPKYGNLGSATAYQDSQHNTSRSLGTSKALCTPGQYIEIENKRYLICARILLKAPNESNNQTRTEVCTPQTNLLEENVNLAAKNAGAYEKDGIDRLHSRIKKEQPECMVEGCGQRNGKASDQDYFKIASTTSQKCIKTESPVNTASCSCSKNIGHVSNRCEHSITKNRETEGTNSFFNCHLNNYPSFPKEESESFVDNRVTYDHSYSVNDTTDSTLSPLVSKKRKTSLSNQRFSNRIKTKAKKNAIMHDHCYSVTDTTNLTYSRIRDSILSLSRRASKKRKASLSKHKPSTKEQQDVLQNSDREQLPTAMKNRQTDNPVFYEDKGSKETNRNAHQSIPGRRQNLGLQQSSSDRLNERIVSSQEEFPNSAVDDSILNQENQTSENELCSCNCTIYEKDTAFLNHSSTAKGSGNTDAQKSITRPNNIVSVSKTSDKGTPHIPQLLTSNSLSLSQAPSCDSGESLAISGSTRNSTSEDDRSFVRSPSIFEFFNPKFLPQGDDGTCKNLEKNRRSSTGENSGESTKCFSAADEAQISNSSQKSIGPTEEKCLGLGLGDSGPVIDDSIRCKLDFSRMCCDADRIEHTTLTGNAKTLTKKESTELSLNNSGQMIENSTGCKDVSEITCNTKCTDPRENFKQLTNSEVSVETCECASKSSHLITKSSSKRKRTGLYDSASLKLSNFADAIYNNKRTRVEHGTQLSPVRSQSTNAFRESISKVQPSEVKVAEVQISEVQNAEVQMPEVRNAEIQTVMVHNSEAQNRKVHYSEVQNSVLPKSIIQTSKVQNAGIQTSLLQISEVQSSVVQNSDGSTNPSEESEETVQRSEESSCWEPTSELLSQDVLSFEEETPIIQSSEVQNSEESSNPGEESEKTALCSEESSWEPTSELLSQDVLSFEEETPIIQSSEVRNSEVLNSEIQSSEETPNSDEVSEGASIWKPKSNLSSQESLSSREESSGVQIVEVSNFRGRASEASNFEGQNFVKVGKGMVLRSKRRASSRLSNKKFQNYADCDLPKLTVGKIKRKYSKILRPIIYTEGTKRDRSIPVSRQRKTRRKRKKSSVSEDDLPLSKWSLPKLRNLPAESSTNKRRRLNKGQIASTKKCNLDTVVKLVRLDAVVKLFKLEVSNYM